MDAPSIAEQVNDWDVVRYTASIPFPYDRRMAEDFIASQQERLFAKRRVLIGMRRLPFDGRAELVWSIRLRLARAGSGRRSGL